jgi:hypothetical protein
MILMRFAIKLLMCLCLISVIALFMPAAQSLGSQPFFTFLVVRTAEAQGSFPMQEGQVKSPPDFPAYQTPLMGTNSGIERCRFMNQKINDSPISSEEIFHHSTSGRLFQYQPTTNNPYSFGPEVKVLSLASGQFMSPNSKSEGISNDSHNSLFVFKLTQRLGGFSFGMGYRHIGKELRDLAEFRKSFTSFVNLQPDQDGFEIWGAREFGPITLRAYVSRLSDNVDRDPERFKMLTNQYGTELNYKASFLPLCFGISCAKANSISLRRPIDANPRSNFANVYSGYVYYYVNSFFDITLSSSYSPINDQLHQAEKIDFFYHEFGASIRPTRYTYISLYGSWSKMQGNQGYQNTRAINSWITLCWYPDSWVNNKVFFSFDIGYEKYLDNIYPQSSYKSLYSFLNMKANF